MHSCSLHLCVYCSYSGNTVAVNIILFGSKFPICIFFCLYSGAALPEVKEKTEHFDSNCITPVSFFFPDEPPVLETFLDTLLHECPY